MHNIYIHKRPIFNYVITLKQRLSFQKSNSIEIYKINQVFNCYSKNVVYLIECRTCKSCILEKKPSILEVLQLSLDIERTTTKELIGNLKTRK